MSIYIPIFLSSSIFPFQCHKNSLEIMNFSCHPESALKKNMNPIFMEVDLIMFCSPCFLINLS